MAVDPTPMDYDEPIHHVEWGAALPDGEAARLLDEKAARLIVKNNPDAILVMREVVYHPWVVVPKSEPKQPAKMKSPGSTP